MTRSSDGGFYHGKNAICYQGGVCPTCGSMGEPEVVPIADCEVAAIEAGDSVTHAVYCSCGTTYYAIYDNHTDYVGLSVPDPSDVDRAWKELLDYVKN